MRYYFIVAIFLFFSCNKSEDKKIIGYVFERDTYFRIEGATVILASKKKNTQNASWIYDSVFTNSNGDYLFSTKKKIGWERYVSVRYKNHFSESMSIDRRNPPYFFALSPYAYLKIRIKKKSNTTNSINVYFSNDVFSYNYPVSFDSIVNKLFVIRANENQTISWSINYSTMPKGPQNPNVLKTDVKVQKSDTLTYLIEYD